MNWLFGYGTQAGAGQVEVKETNEARIKKRIVLIMANDPALKEYTWFVEGMTDEEIRAYHMTLKREAPEITTIEQAMQLAMEKVTHMAPVLSSVTQNTQKEFLSLYKELKEKEHLSAN